MEEIKIDINADLGEGTGNDEKVMPLISSCSIACGGHYGDEDSIRDTIHLAKKYNVKVGAHPSFPDVENFGRKQLTLTKHELTKAVFDQISLFHRISISEAIEMNHVKLHGALYNYAAIDAPTADAVVDAILQTKQRPKLYVQYNSILYHKAKNLLPLVCEGFIDRRYTDGLQLVSRGEMAAIIETPQEAWEQLRLMIFNKQVKTNTANFKSIEAQTYCIHGDHEHAIEILQYIHAQFQLFNISLEK